MKTNLTPYLLTIIFAFVVIGSINCFVTDYSFWFIAVCLLGSIIFVIAVHGLSNAMFHLFVNKINPQAKFFSVGKKQRTFLASLGAKHLKQYVPDLGSLVKFPKNKIVSPKDPAYVYKYLQESAIGELGHIGGALLGFTLMIFVPTEYWWCWVLPVAIINALMGIMPIIVLRYNRCTLLMLYQRVAVNGNKIGY